LCISCMMDPNASCVSCCVVEAMARRTGREGGTWTTAASMVDGSGYQIVMVLDWVGRFWDHPAEGLIPISCLSNTDLSSTFYRFRRLKA
jgi:hypothetical protein